MTKSILNLGKALNKAEQQIIKGEGIYIQNVHHMSCQGPGSFWSPSHEGSEYGTCVHFIV